MVAVVKNRTFKLARDACMYQLAEMGTVYQIEFENFFLQRNLIFGNSWSCPAGPLASTLYVKQYATSS